MTNIIPWRSFYNNYISACPNGEFYSSVSNSCVTECPCGMYGDTASAMCRQGIIMCMIIDV